MDTPQIQSYVHRYMYTLPSIVAVNQLKKRRKVSCAQNQQQPLTVSCLFVQVNNNGPIQVHTLYELKS